jgi:V/A-type H+-transporting ATPase subunit I
MRWREALNPVEMQRVALLAPRQALRDVLVQVADAGTVDLDDPDADTAQGRATSDAEARLRRLAPPAGTGAALSPVLPDLEWCETEGRADLIAGEAQLEARSARALTRGEVAALAGWMPAHDVPDLSDRVAGLGGAVVPLARPPGSVPPTLLPDSGVAREFAPLVQTYATVPYADVNPSVIAGLAYVLMFGMMFADAGHGALLVLAAVAVRGQWSPRLARLRPAWLFLAGAGVASMVFGLLYGEFFGPTGVVPVVWVAPLDHPVPLLGAAVGVGALLLAGAYVLGTINRVREAGWRRAAYAPSGLAGSAVFLGLGTVASALALGADRLVPMGVVITAAGLAGAYAGMLAGAGGGPAGAAQAGIELFDLVLRLGSNLVSFARLAAFGLTHAALGQVIWQACSGLWGRGVPAAAGAVAVFVLGNALSFALEGLVAGIQALRLEYYELFSRIFDTEGRPFRPWHVPLATTEAPCPSG